MLNTDQPEKGNLAPLARLASGAGRLDLTERRTSFTGWWFQPLFFPFAVLCLVGIWSYHARSHRRLGETVIVRLDDPIGVALFSYNIGKNSRTFGFSLGCGQGNSEPVHGCANRTVQAFRVDLRPRCLKCPILFSANKSLVCACWVGAAPQVSFSEDLVTNLRQSQKEEGRWLFRICTAAALIETQHAEALKALEVSNNVQGPNAGCVTLRPPHWILWVLSEPTHACSCERHQDLQHEAEEAIAYENLGPLLVVDTRNPPWFNSISDGSWPSLHHSGDRMV